VIAKVDSYGKVARLGLSDHKQSYLEFLSTGSEMKVNLQRGGIDRATHRVKHRNGEWRILMVSWDSKQGRLYTSNSPLVGGTVSENAYATTAFSAVPTHLELGDGAKSAVMEVMIFDQALDRASCSAIRSQLEAVFGAKIGSSRATLTLASASH
ncbi:MAG: hypothetical protein AAF226_12275, partial [Verrucomicrobiota bacterium]